MSEENCESTDLRYFHSMNVKENAGEGNLTASSKRMTKLEKTLTERLDGPFESMPDNLLVEIRQMSEKRKLQKQNGDNGKTS